MSIINEATAGCSKCGNRHNIKVYKSINIAENPELKEKVKDGSLFLWECPACGNMNLAKYETLYHDPSEKIMLWLVNDENVSETQIQAVSNHAKAMGNYRLRLVGNMGDLIEKVMVFDAGLDDVVVELCKYVTRMELADRVQGTEAASGIMSADFHFYRLNEEEDGSRSITFMFHDGKQMASTSIGYNVYEDCSGILQRNPFLAPQGFGRVDFSWIMQNMGK